MTTYFKPVTAAAALLCQFLFLPPQAHSAEIYRCTSKNGQLVLQDHPCDGGAPAISAPPPSAPLSERQAAHVDCEEWSQVGYLAAVARDAQKPQQHVLERYGRDGLDDGERAAIDWAYRDPNSSPELVKRLIREDCLRERQQDMPRATFRNQPDKQPGDFMIGDQKYHAIANHPWVLDYTQSGKTGASLQFLANQPEQGRMNGNCQMLAKPMTRDQATDSLRAIAMSSSVDLSAISEPAFHYENYSEGMFVYTTMPLRRSQSHSTATLKEPRYATFGLLIKGTLRCDFRAETYLQDGPAQRGAIKTMQTVHARK